MEPNEVNHTAPREEGAVGPVIATIIILAVIVLGGLYFWGERNAGVDTTEDINSALDREDENSADAIEAELEGAEIPEEEFEIQAS